MKSKCALKCKADGEAENSLPTSEGGVEVLKPDTDLLLIGPLIHTQVKIFCVCVGKDYVTKISHALKVEE